MARDIIVNFRLSQIERQKAEQIIKMKGFTNLAECIQYALDRVYLNEVVGEKHG